MKNLLKLSLIFLLILSSCSKDNNDEITPKTKDGVSTELISKLTNSAVTARSSNQASEYLEDGECFVINYPYSIFDGQSSTTINSDEELETYLSSLGVNSVILIEVPFDVTLANGTQQTITTYNEFYEVISSCFGGVQGSMDQCFQLNFPLTAHDSDGNEVTVSSEQELFSFDFSGFVYPISVTLTDGTQVTINSSQDFDTLYNDCYGIDDCDDCGYVCFEIVFPFSFVVNDGNVETINDYDELWNFLSGLTADDTFVISYPITVEFEDGSQQTANSDEELAAIYESCD